MRLSETEQLIMEKVWEKGTPVTAAELLQEMSAEKSWKMTTMLTFLSRLCDKSFLKAEKRGKTNWYTAAVSKKSYRMGAAKELLNGLYGGSVKGLVASLTENEGLTGEDIESLRRWLETR
ncbi:MAG: BlaI/MecI/CopY family transcriptional regulator [Oscillospiraceae bacterium]|nr:BlaI/MecI/CopY family transcriptional regulator [Oscillospiraceae bacterium]